jgi:uncharacterized protein
MLTSIQSDFSVIRMLPGDDLYGNLEQFVRTSRINAGFVVTCAGSLIKANLRFAANREGTEIPGPCEIVSLSGTLSEDGLHLHMAVSDCKGKTTGGHLMLGNVVYTTCEIVICNLHDLKFSRSHDVRTGYNELSISRIPYDK